MCVKFKKLMDLQTGCVIISKTTYFYCEKISL